MGWGPLYPRPPLSLAALLAKLDPDPDKRGREFERVCRWYLTNAPEYRGRFRRIWLWAEWPDAWGPDAGVDLVAEEQDGDPWAIQAKAYAPNYAIRKADVDSFLSESSRAGFTYRLLIATTDRLGATAKRTLDAQREPVGYRLRSDLELAPVGVVIVTPRVVECQSCGVVSRFPADREPRPRRGWHGNGTVCPACHRREMSARLDAMSDAERREVAKEAIVANPRSRSRSSPIGRSFRERS